MHAPSLRVALLVFNAHPRECHCAYCAILSTRALRLHRGGLSSGSWAARSSEERVGIEDLQRIACQANSGKS